MQKLAKYSQALSIDQNTQHIGININRVEIKLKEFNIHNSATS